MKQYCIFYDDGGMIFQGTVVLVRPRQAAQARLMQCRTELEADDADWLSRIVGRAHQAFTNIVWATWHLIFSSRFRPRPDWTRCICPLCYILCPLLRPSPPLNPPIGLIATSEPLYLLHNSHVVTLKHREASLLDN